MNALINMACVQDGTNTLKERSIIEMGSTMTQVAALYRQEGKPTEAIAKFEEQAADLIKKAESLPDAFFAQIDCPFDFAGKEICRAVAAA